MERDSAASKSRSHTRISTHLNLLRTLFLGCSIIIIQACGGGGSEGGGESPTPTPTVSFTPTPSASPNPSPLASPTPSPSPTVSPQIFVSPSPSPTTIIPEEGSGPESWGYTVNASTSHDFSDGFIEASWDLTDGGVPTISDEMSVLTVSFAEGASEYTLTGSADASFSHSELINPTYVEMRVALPSGAGVEVTVGLMPQASIFDGPAEIAAASGENLGQSDARYEFGVVYGNNVSQIYDYLAPDSEVLLASPSIADSIDPVAWQTYLIELGNETIRFYLELEGGYEHVGSINRATIWNYAFDDARESTTFYRRVFDEQLVPYFRVTAEAGTDSVSPLMIDHVNVYECLQDLCVNEVYDAEIDSLAVIENPNRLPGNTWNYETQLFYNGPSELTWYHSDESLPLFVDSNGASVTEEDFIAEGQDQGDGISELYVEFSGAYEANVQINPPRILELTGAGLRVVFYLLFDSESTNAETLDVIISSGGADYGFVTLDIDEMNPNEWTFFSIPAENFLNSPNDGGEGLDLTSVTSLLQFQFSEPIAFWLREAYLRCTSSEPCGVVDPDIDSAPVGEGGPITLLGAWSLAPERGALGVGPVPGDISWWLNPLDEVDARSCHFDDVYRFADDGTFSVDLGDETWLEPWQQGGTQGCGAPVSPHLSGEYSYALTPGYNEDDFGILTLIGSGAHMGLPNVTDSGQISEGTAVPDERSYTIIELTDTTMTLEVDYGDGFWTFNFVRVGEASTPLGN